MEAEPLQNLTEQSGGVARWLVTVVMPPQEVKYNWNKGGKSGEGKKLQYMLASEDGAQYCEGIYRRIGKEPKATDDYNKAKQKFKKGTIWTVSKVSLAKQNTQYLGCSCKEDGRIGSWRPNGELTHINRYRVDFINNVQTNLDNGRKRSIRIVWVRPEDVEAKFTGELPEEWIADD